ncbi:PRE7 [[Candida] subhashii]|uniref:Proteasome subunit beta n=1 Tax=[Candida] subhashii TaxID=561895 RepID=A0A8J5QR88_9ASCO|nr:PRE7 [[Candida] subhashii]KAG7666058.1 PRE7 [[Candida] subhashii]
MNDTSTSLDIVLFNNLGDNIRLNSYQFDHPHSSDVRNRFSFSLEIEKLVIGIAGEDFAVLAGDTRQVEGYSIQSRYEPKIFNVGDDILMTANGFAADGVALIDRFRQQLKWYKFDNGGKKLRIQSAARYIQHLLYGKRFFPYYVSTLIAGLDEEGKGAVYSYDPVGSYEREQCRAGGAAASLIMPFLDNQVNFKNQFEPGTNGKVKKPLKYLSLEEVLELVKDAFSSATERHIYVGDGLEILIVTKDGVRTEYYPLKRD